MPDDVRDKLLHVADLHFWRLTFNPFRQMNKRILGNLNLFLRRRHQFVMDRAQPGLDRVRSIGIPDLLFTGDFTTTSLPEEYEMSRTFMRRASDAGLRPVAIPGNHDVYTFAAERQNLFRQFLGEWTLAEPLPGLYQLPGGTPVVLAPTVCANWISSKGVIREKEVASLKTLLDGLDGPTIVAGHYPLLTETTAYSINSDRRLRGAELLRRALGECGRPILYVCGHVHRFSYVTDPEYANVQHVTTGTLFGRNRPQHRDGEFTEIHATSAGWAVFNHVHDGTWRRDSVPCA